MAQELRGMPVVESIKQAELVKVAALQDKGITPTLAIVRLGERADDLSYERGAIKRSEGMGIAHKIFAYPIDFTEEQLIDELQKINNDTSIHGVLLFRPLPKHIDENKIKNILNPSKDIDCLNPVNLAKTFAGDNSGYPPCTPQAVIEMLDHYGIDVTGKRVTIIGRSLVVGKPLAMLLLQKNATVTICHTRTKDLAKECQKAEILIAAAGVAKMVTAEYVSSGQIVIDVGINVDADGNLCGDVDYSAVSEIVQAITPVPGGVGTVTTSVLCKHVIKSAMGN